MDEGIKRKGINMKTLQSLRKRYLSEPLFSYFKNALPKLSKTEQEAMKAGTVWWEAELFSGHPSWETLLAYPKPELSSEEQHFIDHQLETLLVMLNDFDIIQQQDLPESVWCYLKENKFFALNIPKSYGGLAFSAHANSTIVAKIATQSLSAAVTVMVPNSLGPAELLIHYGTQEQRDYWLPRLVAGKDIPCFALTGPESGSDAGSIPDLGIVCMGEFEGESRLGIRLQWNKRYITLAPVATVLGLAFKMQDPDGLIGDKVNIGITCALIPTDHPGVQIGDRHMPLGAAFMNGTTRGKDVFIPMEWVIGGQDYVGQGWSMLMECLSSGRGVSLPALSIGIAQLCAKTTGAYAYVRKQFGQHIGHFEGVAEGLGRIGGLTYLMEATRHLTNTAVDLNEKPAIVSAISKYHMTELARKILNDALDIHAGKAIQLGESNYLAHLYCAMPIAITVEGSNILTRNLMIFGQGATRCHPYLLKEIELAAKEEDDLDAFDTLLTQHIAYLAKNTCYGFANALTRSYFNASPVSGEIATYYRDITRLSRAFSVTADIALLCLGGELKRREMLSARFGDVLSHLYMATATLKYFESQGRPPSDLPLLNYALKYCLHQSSRAFEGIYKNFPRPVLGRVLKSIFFPFGMHFSPPSDKQAQAVAKQLMSPGPHRDRLTHLCYVGHQNHHVEKIESAFHAMCNSEKIKKKLNNALKLGKMTQSKSIEEQYEQAIQLGILTPTEVELLTEMERLRQQAIQVDEFQPSWFAAQQTR